MEEKRLVDLSRVGEYKSTIPEFNKVVWIELSDFFRHRDTMVLT
jgi:hypothetical protein